MTGNGEDVMGSNTLLPRAGSRRARTAQSTTGTGPAWRSRPASARAVSYLDSLRRKHLADRLGPLPEGVTAGQVSDAIDWCLRQPLRPAAPPPEPVPDGIYLWNGPDPREGASDPTPAHWIVRIRTAVYSEAAGRQYGQALPATVLDAEAPEPGEYHDKPEWERAPGILRKFAEHPATLLPEAEASRFGKLYGTCIFCYRTLTDDRSIARGYGPICAANGGLPWGEDKEGD